MAHPHSRNASIDGWRGVSVLFVILGHFSFYRFADGIPAANYQELLAGGSLFILQQVGVRLATYFQSLAVIGVDIFYIISGFLITSLLISEEARNGSISVPAFYVRRTLRIMPAFYLMWLTTVLLGYFGIINLPASAAIRSATYTCNFDIPSCSWWLMHTWSLGVEEQFYLLWPSIFFLARTWRNVFLVGIAIVLPLLAHRIGPDWYAFEYIAVGALIATFKETRCFIERWASTWAMAAAVVLVFATPLLGKLSFVQALLQTLQPAVLAFILFGALAGNGPFAKLITRVPMQKLGLVSYSVYLWQEMASAPREWFGLATNAELYLNRYALLCWFFLVPALLSYRYVEQPLIAVGRKWSAKIIEARNARLRGLAPGTDSAAMQRAAE